ncbi:MAG: response regulator [Limisphaerales bacterium]
MICYLLITDNEMPDATGVELLKMLHTARMTLPIIMATATFPKEEFTRSPWLQPEVTLLKPYTLAEFFGTVEEVLNTSQATHLAANPAAVWNVRRSANRLQRCCPVH